MMQYFHIARFSNIRDLSEHTDLTCQDTVNYWRSQLISQQLWYSPNSREADTEAHIDKGRLSTSQHQFVLDRKAVTGIYLILLVLIRTTSSSHLTIEHLL